jgi:ribosomal protein L7/L12
MTPHQIKTLLAFHTLDHSKVLAWVAENNPAVFFAAVDAASAPAAANPFAWGMELWSLEKDPTDAASSYIRAIKLVRERAGLGLRDAKQVVDALRGVDLESLLSPAAAAVLWGLGSVGVTRISV